MSRGVRSDSRSSQPRLRCAVYTRKSTEEGLDQAFNSLDAQREACAAFITSQGGLGWRLIADLYDDGGISGGTMERPALQRLLQDIGDKKIDVVVVYKIDRLTRSLADFARIVEVFDTNGVSFVSVTQQFNTTTSMGRLTLNVLLSFAQFEREVTAERIRDKIAASRKKGMWMGGRVPLGYSARDRKLVVKEPEAGFVRHLFTRYLELSSVPKLAKEISRLALDQSSGLDGSHVRRLSPGMLYKLLANPLYIGKVRHRGQVHDGEHQAIVDSRLFERVQAALADRAPVDRGHAMHGDTHLLTGILFDDTGQRMAPTHAKNHGRRYRYYVSAHLLPKRGGQPGQEGVARGWRLPASELDDAVMEIVAGLLRDRTRIASWIERQASPVYIDGGLRAAAELSDRLDNAASPQLRRRLLRSIVQRAELGSGTLGLTIDTAGLVQTLLGTEMTQAEGGSRPQKHEEQGNSRETYSLGEPSADDSGDAANSPSLPLHAGDETTHQAFVLTVPMALKRRGNQARIVVESQLKPSRSPDPVLVDLIARAHLYLACLTSNPAGGIACVARRHRVHRADVSRILPLVFLAPAITEAILTGTRPVELSARHLSRLDMPLLWVDQDAAIAA